MNDVDYLKTVIGKLEGNYSALETSRWIERPKWTAEISQFRHDKRHDCLFVFLKGVRMVSLLNASLVLLHAGHAHEIGILCRCMDEAVEDMLLFPRNLGKDDQPTDLQKRVLSEFFNEQFE